MCPELMNCSAGESMKANVALEDIPNDYFDAALQVKKSLEMWRKICDPTDRDVRGCTNTAL